MLSKEKHSGLPSSLLGTAAAGKGEHSFRKQQPAAEVLSCGRGYPFWVTLSQLLASFAAWPGSPDLNKGHKGGSSECSKGVLKVSFASCTGSPHQHFMCEQSKEETIKSFHFPHQQLISSYCQGAVCTFKSVMCILHSELIQTCCQTAENAELLNRTKHYKTEPWLWWVETCLSHLPSMVTWLQCWGFPVYWALSHFCTATLHQEISVTFRKADVQQE